MTSKSKYCKTLLCWNYLHDHTGDLCQICISNELKLYNPTQKSCINEEKNINSIHNNVYSQRLTSKANIQESSLRSEETSPYLEETPNISNISVIHEQSISNIQDSKLETKADSGICSIS